MRKDESTYREYMDRITLSDTQQEKLAEALREAAGRMESKEKPEDIKPFVKKKTVIRRLAPVCMAAAACLVIFIGFADRDKTQRMNNDIKEASELTVMYSKTEANVPALEAPEAISATHQMPASYKADTEGKNIPNEAALEETASGDTNRNENRSAERCLFLLEGKTYILDMRAQVFTDGEQTVLLKIPEEVMKRLNSNPEASAAELIAALSEYALKAENACGEAADPAFWEMLREKAEFSRE